MKSKGQQEIITVLGTVAMAAITVFFIIEILPKAITDFQQFVSLASAEVVSRNLAGIISISAAAPNQITINYQPSEDYKYYVRTKNRVVDVKLLTQRFGMSGEIVSETAVDSKCYDGRETTCEFNEVNFFTVRKWSEGPKYVCDLDAS